ncbi:uncharacterized protein EV420DRAFT_1498721 [Desarmillaria tabescens]|uniref:Zn(2)-C6 fungal-type domain-containing protein n=1 Tax=Armillaria tabescens TaxID=1929756 RepID=A0AA39NQY3_ARMTA|nr:uncharacterized protein EV420DRAFT_1498721 [Desarmillaria tabescens]KAK0470166.1 hypothetical protein EV420DRAFT_1498721 [Desarmillaria tabescens]
MQSGESLPSGNTLSASQTRTKRSKVQSCDSCRRCKTRCEILNPKRSPVRCHRCNVLKISCSYESRGEKAPAPEYSSNSSGLNTEPSLQVVYALGVDTRQLEIDRPPDADIASGAGSNGIRPVIWSFVRQNLDWSAPILAMQELARQPSQEQSPVPVIVNSLLLSNILTRVEIEHLLKLFSVNYSPWLNFYLVQDGPTPFLDLVCCTIASRYLDLSTRSVVGPQLQKLTEDTIARVVFNPEMFESEDTIQGLIILSLWAPICGSTKGGSGDGRMLIGMAITMAMNLRLGEAVATAISLRNSRLLGEGDQAALEKALNKARLWMTLSTTESMLCVGTRRTPLTSRSAFDWTIFPIISPSNSSDGRDLRIRLLAEIFDSTEQGLKVQFASRADMETWFNEVTNVLSAMDRLSRLISPLSVVSNHDRFHYHMLFLLLQCCRLLVLYNAIFIARHVTSTARRWFLEIQPYDLNIIPIWSKECFSIGEAIMVSLLQCDKNLLPTTPDVLFTMMAFAGGLIVGAKLLMLDKNGIEFLGCGDALYEQSVRVLGDAAISPDHAAGRCSVLMGAMHASWMERRRGSELEKVYLGAHSQPVGSGLSLGTKAEADRLGDQSANIDMFQDLEFWSTFFGGGMGSESSAFFSQDNSGEMYT